MLRNASQDLDQPQTLNCPTCHRPWHTQASHGAREDRPASSGGSPSFINHDYFRMLHQSLPGSQQSSAPPSPRRRLVQPVGSGTANSIPPPLGVGFIGSSPAPPSQTHGISSMAFTEKYFEKFFVVRKELGRGGRGVVLLVEHILDRVSLGYFACKRVPIGDDHAWLEKVLVEVQLLQTLSHQNLVSYRHVWLEDVRLSPFSPSVPCAFILQQYCNGGDLHNYVCSSAQASTSTRELKERIRRRSKGETEMPRTALEPRRLQFDEIYSFFKDITSGLRFLHSSGFIHRDLKPSNCLLHTIGHETRVLVSDFGEVQYENAMRKSSGATGTISYCAPEVLRRVSPGGPYGNFTFKSDIFSLGMILYFLCFATLPYQYANVLHEELEDFDHLREEITEWQGFNDERKVRPDLPEKLYVFLKRLLSTLPDDRPSAEEVHNGIRTGAGLDEHPRYTHPPHSPIEEITPGRRIVKLDSPAKPSSPTRGARQEVSQSSALMRSGLLRRPRSRQPLNLESGVNGSDDDNAAVTNVDDPAPSRTAASPDRDIVLHPHTSSPRDELPPDLSIRSPLLLPPAPQARMRQSRRITFLSASLTPTSLRTVLLVLKLLSLLQPCASRGVGINPAVVYPLMLFAVLEFTLPEYRLGNGLLAIAAHVVVLGLTLKMNNLCANGRKPEWKR